MNCAMFNALHSLCNTNRIISAKHIDTVSDGEGMLNKFDAGLFFFLWVGMIEAGIH